MIRFDDRPGSWNWLEPSQVNESTISSLVVANRCATDVPFLNFVCQTVDMAIKVKSQSMIDRWHFVFFPRNSASTEVHRYVWSLISTWKKIVRRFFIRYRNKTRRRKRNMTTKITWPVNSCLTFSKDWNENVLIWDVQIIWFYLNFRILLHFKSKSIRFQPGKEKSMRNISEM